MDLAEGGHAAIGVRRRLPAAGGVHLHLGEHVGAQYAAGTVELALLVLAQPHLTGVVPGTEGWLLEPRGLNRSLGLRRTSSATSFSTVST